MRLNVHEIRRHMARLRMDEHDLAAEMVGSLATRQATAQWVRLMLDGGAAATVTERVATGLAAALGTGLSEVLDAQQDPDAVIRAVQDELGQISQRLADIAAALHAPGPPA